MFNFWEKHPLGEFQKNLNAKTLKERPKKNIRFQKVRIQRFCQKHPVGGITKKRAGNDFWSSFERV